MKRITNGWHGLIGLLIVVFFSTLVFSCSSPAERRAIKRAEEKAAALEKEVAGMIAKWNARVDWDADIPSPRPLGEMILTSQIQEILEDSREKPLFARLNVLDIIKQDDGTYLGIFEREEFFSERQMTFRLELKGEQYDKIVASGLNRDIIFGHSSEEFAVIMRVLSVHSSRNYSDLSSYRSGQNFETIIWGYFSSIIIGECLDIVLYR